MKLAQHIPAKFRKVVYIALTVGLAVVAAKAPSGYDTVVSLLGAAGFVVAHGNVTEG